MTAALTAALTWHLARSSGWVAWLLLGCSVVWGALATGRLVAGRGMPRWLTELHRHLALLTVLLLAVHLGSLLLDDWVRFTPVDVLVPGASSWRTGPVALGVVAMWLVAVVQLSSVQLSSVQLSSLRVLRLPRRWWRALHLLSYPAWCLAAVHGVLAGTDATTPLARAMIAAMTTAVSFVVLGRLLQLGRRGRRHAADAATSG